MPPTLSVDILVLGAGWTSEFLIPLFIARGLSFAATTRDGRTLPSGHASLIFDFDPDAPPSHEQFTSLPDAKTILITFPIKVSGASSRLVNGYMKSRSLNTEEGDSDREERKVLFVQLGSTGIWDGGPTITANPDPRANNRHNSTWNDRHSPFDTSNPRAIAESELLALSSDSSTPTTVLNLCGLWGGARTIRNWLPRVGASKDMIKSKGIIHMIHGDDVSRAILAVHDASRRLTPSHPPISEGPESASATLSDVTGQRWLLTDLHSHDYWDIFYALGSPEQRAWVCELMRETAVRSLPRSAEDVGRGLDSREFWEQFGIMPERGRLE